MTPNPKKVTVKGEPLVWFSAMGLSIGLLMIVGLLGLILVRGLEVFWPKRVAEIKIENSTGAKETLLGEVVLKQTRHRHGLQNKKEGKQEEWKLFLGNKDVIGQTFRFIEKDQIRHETYPQGAMILKRMEYGDAIGYPVTLSLANGTKMAATHPEFSPLLQKLVEDSTRRWKEINHIEKKEIGDISLKLEKIELKKKVSEKKANPPAERQETLKKLAAKKEKLQNRYQTLAKEVRTLREEQKKSHLLFRMADGQERQIEGGQILHYYFPNRLSLTDRTGLFFRNIWEFLSEDPREANTEGGIFPALFGTLVMTILMSLAVVPFGVMAAVYLSEYAKPGILVRLVRIAVNNLAGVPSIVFGVFGLGFFVYMVGGTIDSLFFSERLPTPTFGTGGLLWASLTMALLTVPVVIVSTEEALSAVSRGIREGALACGASKWQAVKQIILPASAPGILTGAILAMARGAGEVAPLMLVGVVKLAPTLPINSTFPYIHLDQKFMHLGFHIFDLGFQSPDSEAAIPMVFATTLLLIALVLVLNLGAIVLRERLRKKYAAGTF